MEGAPNEEDPTEFDIIAQAIKEKGSEDPETREALIAWTIKQEETIEAIEDREAHALAKIAFERTRARLYKIAGYSDAGLQTLQDAREIAGNERLDDLAGEIALEIESWND